VRIGEDADGVWVAGALRHGVTGEQVATALGCTLSGDWQPHPDRAGVNEFIAALLVPVPGFPMARTQPSVAYNDGLVTASSVPVRLGLPEPPSVEEQARQALRTAKAALLTRVGMDPYSRKRDIMSRVGG
jgi:enamine deaminase RidA (YjgF/YER057c/UK114 family)